MSTNETNRQFVNSWVEDKEDGEHLITRLTLYNCNAMQVDTPLANDAQAEYKHYESVRDLIDLAITSKLKK